MPQTLSKHIRLFLVYQFPIPILVFVQGDSPLNGMTSFFLAPFLALAAEEKAKKEAEEKARLAAEEKQKEMEAKSQAEDGAAGKAEKKASGEAKTHPVNGTRTNKSDNPHGKNPKAEKSAGEKQQNGE